MVAALYLYRSTGDDDELRYSVRSLRFVTPRVTRLAIAGDCPAWLDATHVACESAHPSKFGRLFDALLAACEDPRTPSRFLLMNDDYHFLARTRVTVEHVGPLAAQIGRQARRHRFCRTLEATATWLERAGFPAPLSYEHHRPLPVERDACRDVLRRAAATNRRNALHARTIYGALAGIGGELVTDLKVRPGEDERWRERSVVSTADVAWGGDAGAWIRGRSPRPSRFER